MRLIVPMMAAAIVGGMAAPASADCMCRAPGLIARHGQVVCIKTPDGFRLARCGMSLNNSSWKILPEACPQASRAVEVELAAQMSATPADPHPFR